MIFSSTVGKSKEAPTTSDTLAAAFRLARYAFCLQLLLLDILRFPGILKTGHGNLGENGEKLSLVWCETVRLAITKEESADTCIICSQGKGCG